MKARAKITVYTLGLLVACAAGTATAQIAPYEDIAEILTDGTERAVAAKGNYAYALTREGDLHTLDISEIPTLSSFRTYEPGGVPLFVDDGNGLLEYQDYLYAYEYGITVVDIDDPSAPSIAATVSTSSRINNMIRSDNYLIACENSKIEVFSLATPELPTQVGALGLDGEGWSVAVYDDYLFVGAGIDDPTLLVIDFSTPSSLRILNEISLQDLPYHMRVFNDSLILSYSSYTQLWSISNPYYPTELEEVSVSGRVCAQHENKMIYDGTIMAVDDQTFNRVQSYDDHSGSQIDGFPFGSSSVSLSDFSIVLIAQQQRILVLRMGECDYNQNGAVSQEDLQDKVETEYPSLATWMESCYNPGAACGDANGDGRVTPRDLKAKTASEYPLITSWVRQCML